ncbi:hypothetical protein ACFL04_04745 [Patescibacteria group bacterium]
MEQLSSIQELFLKQAKQQKRKIAVGIWRPEPEIVLSLKKAATYADMIVVGSDIEGLNCIPTDDDDSASRKLVSMLKNKEVEGLVRGQVKDSFTHKLYEEELGRPPEKVKSVFVVLAKGAQWFVVPSVSNYNAMTLESKKTEIEDAVGWLQKLGFTPKIGITSTRRPSGRVGEFPMLEEIAQRCEETAVYLRGKGYDVEEYYIEYERAVWEGRNVVAPSVGIIGNTWIKGLTLVGDVTMVHTPYLNQGVPYDDTTRNNKNWFWPVISTAAWINRGDIK